MPHLELLPAVDIADGHAVQLVQGVAGSEKHFGDPVEAALRWQEAGAEWLHLVDLDAAFGRGDNRELQARIVGALDIRVEMSGGIRDDESLRRALATGCARVNIGTAALEDPEWCARAIAEQAGVAAQQVEGLGRLRVAPHGHPAGRAHRQQGPRELLGAHVHRVRSRRHRATKTPSGSAPTTG